jgi:hypothetical protein
MRERPGCSAASSAATCSRSKERSELLRGAMAPRWRSSMAFSAWNWPLLGGSVWEGEGRIGKQIDGEGKG